MNAHLIKALQDLRASYWFLPSSLVACALLLAAATLAVDARVQLPTGEGWGWLTHTRPVGARAMLTVVASAVIGIAGVTFSITMVAVSFASSQYGPRLIGNFMRDRANQATLGILIATFVYCLLILRAVQGGAGALEEQSFVPHASLLVTMGLTLICIGSLIYFVHHIPESINVGNISARLGREMQSAVSELFPDRSEPEEEGWTDDAWMQRFGQGEPGELATQENGYIQTLEVDRLGRIAADNDLRVRLSYRPGDFVHEGSRVLYFWPASAACDELEAELRSCFAVGVHRTAHQNLFFLIDQLVEVMARALSPGINDPFTANACLDQVRAGLLAFAQREDSSAPAATARVLTHRLRFPDLMQRLFGQARPYLSGDRNAAMHAMAILSELGPFLVSDSQREQVDLHLQQLMQACRDRLQGEDLRDVEARFALAQHYLQDPAAAEAAQRDQGFFGGTA